MAQTVPIKKEVLEMINTIKTEDFRYSVMKNIRGGRNTEENEIHYIGGSEILPAPLSQKEESTVVIDLLNNNSIDARKTLIERNLRLVVYIAKKIRQYRRWYRGSHIHRNHRTYKGNKHLQI